jgi:putative transposase
MAPSPGASEMGGLPWPTAAGKAADLDRIPGTHPPPGEGEPELGLLQDSRELLKLGHTVAATTIRSVLLHAKVSPSPSRAQLSWKRSLAAHAQTLVAADFFSVDTIFFKRLYVFIYMHLATRRILLASCTSNPSEAWMSQQARNLIWTLEEEGIDLSAVSTIETRSLLPRPT